MHIDVNETNTKVLGNNRSTSTNKDSTNGKEKATYICTSTYIDVCINESSIHLCHQFIFEYP